VLNSSVQATADQTIADGRTGRDDSWSFGKALSCLEHPLTVVRKVLVRDKPAERHRQETPPAFAQP
jgi:hypothetical protein